MFPRSFSPEKCQAFDHAVVSPVSRQKRQSSAERRGGDEGILFLYENIGVDQDPDFCQARISLRNASSETLRDSLRIDRT